MRRTTAASVRSVIRVCGPNHVIAKAKPAAGPPHFQPTAQAASGLVCEVLQKERAHGAFQADMQFADLVLGQCHDAHIREAHPFVEPGDIFLVTRQPIQRFREDYVETPLEPVGDQFLNTWTEERGPGDRAIRVAVDNRPAFAFRTRTTDAQLILNGGITLIVR